MKQAPAPSPRKFLSPVSPCATPARRSQVCPTSLLPETLLSTETAQTDGFSTTGSQKSHHLIRSQESAIQLTCKLCFYGREQHGKAPSYRYTTADTDPALCRTLRTNPHRPACYGGLHHPNLTLSLNVTSRRRLVTHLQGFDAS